MSRTIRRVGKACDPTVKAHHIEKDDVIFLGHNGYRFHWYWDRMQAPREFKTGKEYRQGFWKYHGDGKYWSRKYDHMDWSQVRSNNREDLIKWFKNEDHECIFFEEINKRDW